MTDISYLDRVHHPMTAITSDLRCLYQHLYCTFVLETKRTSIGIYIFTNKLFQDFIRIEKMKKAFPAELCNKI